MNIKEHIEAGHYPKDEKGRALVPSVLVGAGTEPAANQRTITICATDKPGKHCLLGWVLSDAVVQSIEMVWPEDGRATEKNCYVCLLPPPPRKVKVTRWAVYSRKGIPANEPAWFVATVDDAAIRKLSPGEFYVELTGEYEEPWS